MLRFCQRDSSFLVVTLVLSVVGSCQKIGTVPSVQKPAALTVVNAIPTSSQIIPIINTTSTIEYFSSAQRIKYGSFYEYSPPGGADSLYVVQSPDTLDLGQQGPDNLFSSILQLNAGAVYSLFLAGTDTNAPDYLFKRDTLPAYGPADSEFGVRFVNMSSGSNPISVDIQGDTIGSEVLSLPYKVITSFKRYFAGSTSPSTYIFEFRDTQSGKLLNSKSTYKFSGILNGTGGNTSTNNYRFRNFTLALIGQPGGNAQTIALINNY